MPSPRRSVIVAVLVLLAGLGFAGCGRAQPGVAFYIGDTRYTEKQIDEIVDEIAAAVPGVDVDTVLVDDVRGAREATATLLAEGHRRGAFLGHRAPALTRQRRPQGLPPGPPPARGARAPPLPGPSPRRGAGVRGRQNLDAGAAPV